ncbi:unnamed protein product, partial [Linum tenue]
DWRDSSPARSSPQVRESLSPQQLLHWPNPARSVKLLQSRGVQRIQQPSGWRNAPGDRIDEQSAELCHQLHNLRGNIPASFGNMSSLKILSMTGNFLSGKVPSTLGELKSLSVLTLSKNCFSGGIPSSIFNLSYLTHVYLGLNQFHGSLPPDMGISLPNLQSFDVALNYDEGIFWYWAFGYFSVGLGCFFLLV